MSGFQEIYETYSRPVYRFLLALTRNETLAEDLLQDVFYQALLHIDRFEGRSSLYTWLCQIGKNAWLKECRRQKHHETCPMEELGELVSQDLTPEEQTIQQEERLRVRHHTYAEVKLKEIAELYEKSETWARVTYYRAKQKIIQEVSK